MCSEASLRTRCDNYIRVILSAPVSHRLRTVRAMTGEHNGDGGLGTDPSSATRLLIDRALRPSDPIARTDCSTAGSDVIVPGPPYGVVA